MKMKNLRLATALAAVLVPQAAVAQHEGHQTGAAQTAAPHGSACAQVQPVVGHIIAAAMARLESARQSNSPAEMRSAVSTLEGALRDIRTQLAPCSAPEEPAAPPAGHTMPGMQQPPATPAPAAPMDHSKMPMGGTPAAKPGAATGSKPAPPTPSTDHSKMPMGGEAKPGKVRDPVNGLMVDPATAPKTTYQGQTYYFSSEQTRKEFLGSPAKFVKKSKA